MHWNSEQLSHFLAKPKKILITSHSSPDGDAIGSSLALWHVLNKMNHEVIVLVPDAFPNFLAWMQGSEAIVIAQNNLKLAQELASKAELIFCLDFNTLSRIGEMGDYIEALPTPKILIDHHQQPSDFSVFKRWDVRASSTAQLIYDFIHEMAWEKHLDLPTAECIYTGIMTDTGSFRFPLTSSKTHETIAKLMNLGVEAAKIHSEVSDNNSYERLQLIGYALSEKMVYKPELKTAYIVLSKEELTRFNYQKGYTEGLVNYGLSIAGVRFAILIAENDNMVKMSFRSKGNFDVNAFARKYFNGGGHNNAAGGRMDTALNEVVSLLENALIENKNLLTADA